MTAASEQLDALVGSWRGSNAFRLMPEDDPYAGPATGNLSRAPGTQLVMLAYTWRHPDDGPQNGLLVLGPSDDTGGAVGLFADSWHQGPAACVCEGQVKTSGVVVAYEYDGWRWQITLEPESGSLRMTMTNIGPDDADGGYNTMVMDLDRTSGPDHG